MRYKILNIVSTMGILVSFLISMFTTKGTINVICVLIMIFSFVLLLVNVFLNRKANHLDGLLFFNFDRGRKNDDNGDGFDDGD